MESHPRAGIHVLYNSFTISAACHVFSTPPTSFFHTPCSLLPTPSSLLPAPTSLLYDFFCHLPPLSNVDTLFIFVRFCCQRNGNEQNIFQTFLTQTCACPCHSNSLSLSFYLFLFLFLLRICVAHQIKQSHGTAVSCTATKDTKNKFALRAINF